jgi:putative ABC transport system substrate-binding protein
MKRREFITLLGGAAAGWPLMVRGQQPGQVRRIGVLMTQSENDPEADARLAAFRRGLQELGWFEGRNLRIEYRFAAGDPFRTRRYAAELVGQSPDLILANGSAILSALRDQTRTIPIVFVLVPDPVAYGFVASLARPGNNLTGLANFEYSMGGKWLEILKELAPRVTRIALLFNPGTAPYAKNFFQVIQAAPAPYRVELTPMPVHAPSEIAPSIAAFASDAHAGLLVLPELFTAAHYEPIVNAANTYRVPAVYPFRYFARKGGLASYGVVTDDLFRRSAKYVDSILRGASPADMPVQAPTKFELAVNLKTAKVLGLDVSPTFLAQADEVIE